MADDEYATSTTFPNPPPFWKDFTPSNTARIEELRTAYSETHGELPHRIPNVPEDLCNLQPPEEPEDGNWRSFGEQRSVRLQNLPSSNC